LSTQDAPLAMRLHAKADDAAETVNAVDSIARMADAWNGYGHWAFTPPTEHQVLLKFAGLPMELHDVSWKELTREQRSSLIKALRRVLDLAQVTGWIFGAVD